jgi:hypothetical protein
VCHALLRDTSFFERLYALDLDLADQARIQGCSCGGRLHQANYLRKPRGGPAGLLPDRERRLSFCCNRDGCRCRTTPPSLRFLGRRVYFGAVVVLLTAMAHGVTPRRAAEPPTSRTPSVLPASRVASSRRSTPRAGSRPRAPKPRQGAATGPYTQ